MFMFMINKAILIDMNTLLQCIRNGRCGIANNTGFIEASDVIIPSAGEWQANPENLRARFLDE